MAANQTTTVTLGSESGLPPKLVSQALEAVASKDSKGSLDLLKQILAQLLGGEAEEPAPTEAPATDPAAAMNDDGKEADMAASRIAMVLTGKSNAAEAMAELARTYKVAVNLEKREEKLAKDRAQLEAGERRTLVGKLVALGAISPALAWEDDAATVPSKQFRDWSLDDLRGRVEKLSGKPKPRTPEPPKGGGAGAGPEVQLTPEQLRICEELKCDPKTFATLMTQRDGAKKGT